jgi:hypothetical protein
LLVAAGNTVIVVEHDMRVVAASAKCEGSRQGDFYVRSEEMRKSSM